MSLMFQKLREPDDSAGGLLDVLFRVRTTLLRRAFSLSSLSRRKSSSRSWGPSALCGSISRTSDQHTRHNTSSEMTHLPRPYPVSLSLSLSLSFDLDPRSRTVRRANISCFAPTFLGPARTGTPSPASTPTRQSSGTSTILCAPAPAPAPTPAPVSLTPSPAQRGS